MRIKSVTVRHYRVHRDLTVELDAAHTLIGGPNESGKSTLIEAMHRALFLKAKGNTENHRAMVSTIHAGQPEVEMDFEADGTSYRLKKRFGSSGTTTLSSVNAISLSGDAAESELARILGVESAATGRVATAQWSHLWIWQGGSGDDPLANAKAQQANLLKRLQDEGGAAAMQSERDTRVAQLFASATDATFTQSGKSKAGSELEKAESAATAAETARQYAATRLGNSLQLVRDFEEATQTLARVAVDIDTLATQKIAVDKQLARADELSGKEATQTIAAQALAEKQVSLEKGHSQILRLCEAVAVTEAALLPQNDETQRLTTARKDAAQQSELVERAYDEACASTRTLRLRRDLAVACLTGLEKAVRLDELAGKLEQARILEGNIANLRQELAKFPEIEAAYLRKLQEMEGEWNAADATLRAMAAGLEVLAADRPVTVGGKVMAAGQTEILTEDTEVACGDSLRLLVRPGGGTTLAEARQAVQDACQKFRTALDIHGIESVTAASDIVARRNDIGNRIKLAEVELRALGAAKLSTVFADARDACVAAKAEVARRSEAFPDFTPPANLAEAKKSIVDEEAKLHAAEASEAQARHVRDLSAETLRKADEALTLHQEAIAKRTHELAELRAQYRLLVENHGDETARVLLLDSTKAARAAADELLAAARRELKALQPELLASDYARLEKALERARGEKKDAEMKRVVAQAGLRSDGSEDPEAALEIATAQAQSAHEHLAGVRRKAEANRLLHRLFLDEQRTLADRFTRPLADKISGYLECLFGAGTRANVILGDDGFSGLQLVRPLQAGGAVPFENLSGGAREQVAAAVRLAMAEVLSQDHNGCLPVLFDDAFANSDPHRVQTLQRMLYLAASRGLQVIILTCNPSDYAALGATQVTLRAERPVVGATHSAISNPTSKADAEA